MPHTVFSGRFPEKNGIVGTVSAAQKGRAERFLRKIEFSEKYNTDKETLYIPNTEKSTRTYIAMKQHCDKRGVKVYNATRGGKLEVFPRINFDELFQ